MNRLGNSYSAKVTKIKRDDDEYEEPVKKYSCITEEDYEKAKGNLTEDEKKMISELYE